MKRHSLDPQLQGPSLLLAWSTSMAAGMKTVHQHGFPSLLLHDLAGVKIWLLVANGGSPHRNFHGEADDKP